MGVQQNPALNVQSILFSLNMFHTIKSIFLLLFFACSCCSKFNATRREKTFSLFSVVQFPNDVCTSTSGTYTNGTCITSSECGDRGGTTSGSCAAGFGVCCIYTYSTTGDIITQNVSYIVNPSYPSNYAPTTTPATISFTVQKTSCDVCRLRLDFEDFQLTAQATTTGYCSTDFFTMRTTAHQTVSPTTQNYGNYPHLCGSNSGQHAYIDMSCTCTDTATLDFTIGDATNNQWKIKLTQLSCNDPDVASSEGCFQYLTAQSGSFQSFGIDNSNMICGHNYATCIRPLDGYCCIEYTPTVFSVPSWHPDGGAVSVCTQDDTDAGVGCTGGISCQRNYVIIPGAQSEAVCKFADATFCYVPPNGMERYCGTLFLPEGQAKDVATAVSQPVISCQRPFRVYLATGSCGIEADTGSNGQSGTNGGPGFNFHYKQLPGGC